MRMPSNMALFEEERCRARASNEAVKQSKNRWARASSSSSYSPDLTTAGTVKSDEDDGNRIQ